MPGDCLLSDWQYHRVCVWGVFRGLVLDHEVLIVQNTNSEMYVDILNNAALLVL